MTGNIFKYLSSWALVLGNPSRITPFADSGSLTFSLMIETTTSSLTSPPDLTIFRIVSMSFGSKSLETVPFNIFLI
jgi:hypothetical protein